MQILVIGSGGREHALCWKLKQSPLAPTLYCAPGNAGIADSAECVELKTVADVIHFCGEKHIDFVMVGPEQPLVDGWADELRAAGIHVCGPSKAAAQLEGSKEFTKSIAAKYGIPTGAYRAFSTLEEAAAYVEEQGAPIVIKADGLAAGKGVTVAMTKEEAHAALCDTFGGKFGAAGNRVVIEEFLEGEEASLFALCDGETALLLGSAQDHKRAFDGDTGPNTGGMGTYTPTPIMTRAMEERVMRELVKPTLEGMKKEGTPFQGVLFAGLMIGPKGPQLIEFNTRFGDPETQSLLMLMKSDLLPLLKASAEGKLAEQPPVEFHAGAALCVVMAAKGYPGDYEKGSVIHGLEKVTSEGVKVFHAGTKESGGKVTAIGGRVLGVTARGETVEKAREKAYAAVKQIDWPEGFCRTDIAWRAVS